MSILHRALAKVFSIGTWKPEPEKKERLALPEWRPESEWTSAKRAPTTLLNHVCYVEDGDPNQRWWGCCDQMVFVEDDQKRSRSPGFVAGAENDYEK